MKRARVHKKHQQTDSDVVWGREAIGKVVGLKPGQVGYLFSKGAFGDAVVKVGHKTLAGDRSKLEKFPNIEG